MTLKEEKENLLKGYELLRKAGVKGLLPLGLCAVLGRGEVTIEYALAKIIEIKENENEPTKTII